MTAALRCCVASASLSKRHRFTVHHPPPAIFFLRPSTVLRSPTPLPPLSMAFSTSSSTPIDSPEHETNRNQQLTHVLKYHNETKHSFNNYAKGPRGLDWANQPNPFRRYDSTKLIPLLHPSTLSNSASSNDDVLFNDTAPSYPSLFSSLPSSKPISIATISQLFYDSLALSAWKSTCYSTWSLRVNPSSGNLHPTESYIIAPRIDSVSESPFVAHYAPKEHALEIRAEMESDFFPNLFPENSFLIGLSSVFWREAWKYGERAFRYCNHDVGHAIGAIAIAAAELGWDVRILDGLGFKDLERLMGLDVSNEFKIPSRPVKGSFPEMEFEHPDCVLLVFSNGVANFDVDYRKLSAAIGEFSVLEWKGKPNILSKEHVCWDVIYRTAEVVKKLLLVEDRVAISPFRRRVCENGEKQGKLCALPFRALSWDAEVHAVLFVHRVVGLPKGLYFLVRNEAQFDDLKKSTRSDFKWVKPEGCPSDLPLYELARGDLQVLAKRISCHQDIAGDGCFSLGMVAHFAPSLQEKGVWMYPRLFWETGLLGQVLYLEAHAVGISATGIGCFFDDAVHEILGLSGSNYQSLYHFTVGGPVLDKRIMSLPAYPGPEA